jgi:PRTRC genetic system protein B
MHDYENDTVGTRIVSVVDIAHALASQLAYSTGLLPENTLWWRNTSIGPVYALYEAPRVRRLALQSESLKPVRYDVPLPGLIFLCIPGNAPWVYAVAGRPISRKDMVFKAPLSNVYGNGRTCPGNNKFPQLPAEVVESFFQSFFTRHADIGGRSAKHPKDITEQWKALNGKTEYPLKDMVKHGTVKDLMEMQMEAE